MSDNLVIDENNFYQYFREVKNTKPERGDVIAVYRATAEFKDGRLKKDVVDALCSDSIGAKTAITLFSKMGHTNRKESFRVIKQICSDLNAGLDKNIVISKAYKYTLEMFFYTKPEYIPQNDPHWDLVAMKNLDDFLDKTKSK